MKKVMLVLLMLSLAAVSMVGCGASSSTESKGSSEAVSSSSIVESSSSEKTDTASSEVESGDPSDEETSKVATGSAKTLDEMKKLFVMDGEKTGEVYVDGSIVYTLTGKKSSDIIAFMEKGIKELDATEVTKTDIPGVYNYTGSFGDNEELVVSVIGTDDSPSIITVTYMEAE